MENVRKRVNINLITFRSGRYGAKAWRAKPDFKFATIFNQDLFAI